MVNKSEQLDKDDIDTSEDIEIKDDDVAVIEEPKVAETYSSAVTTVSGQTIKVAGKKDGRWSAVTEKTDA